MSETMAVAIIGVIGTVVVTAIGTLLGYLLTRKATNDERDHNDKRQAESTKAIVSLEIDRNLDSLRELWLQVNQVASQGDDTQMRKLRLARRFIESSVPTWKKDALNSQLSILATALDAQEITRVFQFYDSLAKLEVFRADLLAADKEQQHEWETYSKGSSSVPLVDALAMQHKFDAVAPQSWDKCEHIVNQLLAEGNPVHT
jgi:hypothetical protein